MTQHESIKSEQLERNFERWLSGDTLTEQELTQLKMHPTWSERMLAFNNMEMLAEQMNSESVDVPNWNKDAGFDQYLRQPSWWQSNGMAMTAMCFSIFACVVMLFDLRVNISEHGLMITSADQLQQQKLSAEFDKLAKQNNEQIQTRLDNFQVNQQQNTAQMVSYILENSRAERKEDILDVVNLIQRQRVDDLDYLKQQFSDINYSIKSVERKSRRRIAELRDDESQLSDE